jgi:two-component system response regulator (stage 0 sporulation protein A)
MKITNMDYTVSCTLKDLGMTPGLLGFGYLKEAVKLTMDDESVVHKRVTKVLYPTIAKMFSTSSSRVERAMRHSIETAWNRAGGPSRAQIEMLRESVNGHRNVPTNTEFVATVVDYLKSLREE